MDIVQEWSDSERTVAGDFIKRAADGERQQVCAGRGGAAGVYRKRKVRREAADSGSD